MKDGKEIKIWECGLCGKEFKFQYTLVRHIPTHTDVRNYQCNMCPKAFRQLSTLAQHKVTHLNLRPFVCEFCCKSFNRISTLISHKKIHYDIKRHICSYCGKGFHQKGNLRNHMYTHTNERPYKCDVCHKGFNQKSNLVCHKLSTHFKKTYHCDVCKLQFTKEVSYASHMSGIHNVKISSLNSVNSSRMQLETNCDSMDKYVFRLPVVYTNACNNNNDGELDSMRPFKLDSRSGLFRVQSQLPTITPIPVNYGHETNYSQFGSMSSKLSLGNLNKELKNQMAVVFTKTQPNVRELKPRLNVPSHENVYGDNCLLHANCFECSSKALTVDGLGTSVYPMPVVSSLPTGLPVNPIFSRSASLAPFNAPISITREDKVHQITQKSVIETSESSSKVIPPNTTPLVHPLSELSESDFQVLGSGQRETINSDNMTSELFEIKTETLNEVPFQIPTPDVVSDIDPSLFSGPETLKDNFKFGLDFDSHFDFFEDAFGSGLLDNVNIASNTAEGLNNAYSHGKFDGSLALIDL
ncbi:hypothetical protein GE061_016204 [Apolygus lucorum]|uniref:C2H2-type domain-containing protein n=1 Tax=Apolygus lucorum TaxID=248454 RepID=A0A8S9XI66_APOLU|nr:hypothetical protein GE061_016204 [Apolygus lucorum]